MGQFQEGIARAVDILVGAHESKLREKQRQDELQQRKDAQDQQQAQFEATQKANEKLFDLQKANIEHQQAQTDLGNAINFQRTGIAPPNTNIQPGLLAPPPGSNQIQPGQVQLPVGAQPGQAQVTMPPLANQAPLVTGAAQNAILQSPSGNVNVVPPLAQSPEQQMIQQQQTQARMEKAREEAAQMARDTARQQAEYERQAKLAQQSHQDYLEILGRQEKFQTDQTNRQERFQTGLANSRNALQLQLAGIKATGGLNGFGGHMSTDDDGNPIFVPNDPSDMIKRTVEDVGNGNLTLEQAKKLYTPKQWPTVAAAVSNSGNSFMTDKQLQFLRDMEHVSGLTSDLFDIHKLRVEHPIALQFGLSDASNAYKTLEEKIGGELAGTSKFLNQVPRFTNVELNQVGKALLPSKDILGHTGAKEFTKYEDFIKNIQDTFNTQLSNLPEAQRNQIRQRLGLNSFKYLGSAIQTPGSQIGAIPGGTPPSQQPGGAQPKYPAPPTGQIIVIQKSTGKPGYLNKKDFDPKKYDMVQGGQ